MSVEQENQDRRVGQDHVEDDADSQAGSQYESDASEASSSPSTTDVLARNRQSTYDILTKFAINMFFPLLNGMMLGFGEILAHELGFRWGWYGARVSIAPFHSRPFNAVPELQSNSRSLNHLPVMIRAWTWCPTTVPWRRDVKHGHGTCLALVATHKPCHPIIVHKFTGMRYECLFVSHLL